MINKDKQLTDQLRKNVVWADLGDSKAKGNLEAIWKTLKAQEFTEKSDPIIVVHPDGESEVYQSKAETQKTVQNRLLYVTKMHRDRRTRLFG